MERDFQVVSQLTRSQAAHRGWKWAYGLCCRERREREAALHRQRRRMFAPALPHFGPRPAFYPPLPGPGFPGIVGGDYDRLPQPFFGTGPGMFGTGSGSGLMFGGSGLRRPGQGRGGNFGL